MARVAPRAIVVMLLCAVCGAFLPGRASAQLATVGAHGWRVLSSARVRVGGREISQPGYRPSSWLRVRPDGAGAVGTEVNALLQNGRCPSVFFSTNMRRCFGFMSQIGPETIPQFAVPWWFRTTFSAPLHRLERTQLIINGVVGAADVWVNGRRIATHRQVQGDYTRFVFDITRLLRRGANALALEVHPNDPATMFTLDNVDWTQIPPDNNTGIQFPIQLHTAGPLAISGAHVVQHDARDLSSALLTLKASVTNTTRRPQSGSLAAVVTAPASSGRQRWMLGRTITLPAGATGNFSLALPIEHPRVWWPYQMGPQPLYHLAMSVRGKDGQDAQTATFGIRTITTRLIGRAKIAPSGSRQFLVNGRPFVFRAGGWSEDLFLRYSAASTAKQIALIRNLGLNGIRTEGKQMPADFYEQMDRAGVLIDAGYQCCDAWQLQDSHQTSPHDFAVLRLSAKTIGENLRNHPSVLNFSWSDDNPTPRQEAVSVGAFRQADFQDPLIASAEYQGARGLGPSGEKEGPYDWVPPSYWYDTTHYDPTDPTRTNVGGAWAFDSEASAGHTVPTLDSLRGFLSAFERLQLWTNPNYNQYHANYESDLPDPATNDGYSFGTLHDLDAAIANRYGHWSSLASYVEEAQVQNYETQRAEFEAYIAHSTRRRAPSTGIVYWQLNKGWPTLLWDLYNYDSDQAGSYFGAKKANERLHVLYTYDDGTVSVDNLGSALESGLSVQARVYDAAGDLLSSQRSRTLSVPPQGVASRLLKPRVPAGTKPPAPAQTYFVELLLRRGRNLIDRNVYWLSTQPDVVDWSRTIGLPQATMSRYASLVGLHALPRATLAVRARTHSAPGPDGADRDTELTITNTSRTRTVAFFIRGDLRRGTASGKAVLSALWSDNDITLWPGESQTLSVRYRGSDLKGSRPVVTVGAWNITRAAVIAH